MDNSWIKLYRKIMEESWYKKPAICHLAQHFIMKANTKDKKIIFNKQELLIKRGQFVTGREILSKETGLTCRQIRTGLQVLINCGFLTSKTTNRFSIISICNYDKYQNIENENDQQNDQQRTSKGPQTRSIYIIYNTTTNKFTNISKKDISQWQKAYPDVNIQSEILQAAEWCKANPKKIQGRKDLRRTLVNWFAREQDKKEVLKKPKPKAQPKPESTGLTAMQKWEIRKKHPEVDEYERKLILDDKNSSLAIQNMVDDYIKDLWVKEMD